MASSQHADQMRDSPYPDWQLETGLLPRDFLVALFCRVCILFRSDRGERISKIRTRVSSYFKVATKGELFVCQIH